MTMRFLPHTAGFGVLLCLLGTIGGARGQETKGFCPDGAAWSQNCLATWNTKTGDYWSEMHGSTGAVCTPSPTRVPPHRQSPISLVPPSVSAPPIGFWNTADVGINRELKNTGHSVKLDLDAPTRSIVFGGQTYKLSELHFHYPSEHIWDGERFALELHLVHANPTGKAVVAVLIRKRDGDQPNAALDALFGKMLSTKDKTEAQAKDTSLIQLVMVDTAKLTAILPANKSYVTYPGSLTTPDCDENVTWLVLTTPIEASQAQIDKFKNAISYDHPFQVNARPWAPNNNRVVIFTSRPNPATRNLIFVKGPGAEPIAEAPGWRLRAPGASYMDFQFTLAQVPPNGLKLRMRHISSTAWPKVGYSPINITMLNKNPPIKANYDVSASAGGSRDYQQQSFTIPAGQLQPNQNTLRVALQPGARTHYWIEWLVIE